MVNLCIMDFDKVAILLSCTNLKCNNTIQWNVNRPVTLRYTHNSDLETSILIVDRISR